MRKTRLIFIWLGACGIFLVTAGSNAAEYVYRYSDAARDSRADGQGVTVLAHAFHQIHDNMRTLVMTKGAHKAYDFFDDVIQSVNFERFLDNPLALPLPDGSRALVLKGARADGHYVVDYERAQIDGFAPHQFLAFGAEIRMREDKDPIPEVKRGFGIDADIKVNSASLSHVTLARSVSGVLRVLAPENITKLPTNSPNQALTPLDQKLMTEFHDAFPIMSATFERYVSAIPFASITRRGIGGKSYTEIASRFVLKIDEFKADYPELGDYVESLMDSFELQISTNYELPDGKRLAHVELDSASRSFVVKFLTSDGAVVPTDAKGIPHPEEALNPELVKHHRGQLVTNVTGHVLGLTFKAGGIVASNEFDDGVIAKASAKITTLPVPTIEGRALGIFPTWAIDLTIPRSLEEYNRLFTQGLLYGSRGRGSYVETVIDTSQANATQVDTKIGTELVDNFFINFGMRVAQSYLWPAPDVLADVRKLSERIAGNLAEDFQKMSSLPTLNGSLAH
ncbi:MAG: hypothetical protein NTY08_11990 [Proteobacteria bacterium]|nr:hypothetical protein [Pseudomonadota bacterium]